MAGDIYFRTSLTGYNKQDVMKFIEKLNCEQTERTSELNENNRILQGELRKAKEEISALKDRCQSLDEKLRAAEQEMAFSAEKAAKYDDMQSSFADLMLNAEHEAQMKIANAEHEAQKIIDSTHAEIERRERELDMLKAEFSDTFVENKQIIEHSKEEFSRVFEKICSSIETVYSKVSNACAKADTENNEKV